MAANTAISWTDRTWNPLLGCEKVSAGCDRCYAIQTATVRAGNPHPAVKAAFAGLTARDADDKLNWTGRVNLLPERLGQPLTWRKPSMVFVNSQSDLFFHQVPESFIAEVFAVMALASRHSFQLLTKRHARMRSLLNKPTFPGMVETRMYQRNADVPRLVWPLTNLWLGVSAEDQRWLDVRVPALLDTPAAVRWVSVEPQLGPINLRQYLTPDGCHTHAGEKFPELCQSSSCGTAIAWVVTGGESGRDARPALTRWFRDIRDQCERAGVAYHHKQNGCWIDDPTAERVPVVDTEGHEWMARMRRVPVKLAGRELDGRLHDAYPTPAMAAV